MGITSLTVDTLEPVIGGKWSAAFIFCFVTSALNIMHVKSIISEHVQRDARKRFGRLELIPFF